MVKCGINRFVVFFEKESGRFHQLGIYIIGMVSNIIFFKLNMVETKQLFIELIVRKTSKWQLVVKQYCSMLR